MKKLVLLVISAIVLAGCGEQPRTGERTEEQKRIDSISEYRLTHRYKYSTHYAPVKFYKMHEPDCPLCKEIRKQEIIAIVDSMMREKANIIKE